MSDKPADLGYATTPTSPLGEGEQVLQSLSPSRDAYIRDHLWMAAIAMAVGMVILWLMDNPHIWTGAIGGLAAIAIRGWYVASDELSARWDITNKRILGPGTRAVRHGEIKQVNTLLSAVQIVTTSGDKHLLKYQADTYATKALLDRIAAGGQP